MKNEKQTKNNNTSFIKENAFLIALYSVVGVLVVVAITLTFFMPSAPEQNEIAQIEDSQNVSSNLAKSYKTQTKTETKTETQATPINNTQSPKQTTAPEKTQAQPVKPSPQATTVPDTSNDKTSSILSSDTASISTDDLIIFEDDQTLTEAQPSMSFATDEDEEYSDYSDSTDSDEYSYAGEFNGEKLMLWPTDGNVVSVYSPEVLVYNQTLDQYKTNDSIGIATTKGADVFASYDGIVKKISKSVDQGNYIMIDHGNGWITTYSQLDDSMKVAVGDQVQKGQQIGTISTPSTQNVMLGTHLDFKVTKNDESINPLDVLE